MTKLVVGRSFLVLCAGATLGIAMVVACDAGPDRAEAQTPPVCCSASASNADAGPTKVVTADTDGNQVQLGVVSVSRKTTRCTRAPLQDLPCEKVLDGPFFLTELESDCPAETASLFANVGDPAEPRAVLHTNREPIHGARLYVKEGEALHIGWTRELAAGPCQIRWSGFKPY